MLPQPTNYKPKVMNDIKAQVNKGRFVRVNYLCQKNDGDEIY